MTKILNIFIAAISFGIAGILIAGQNGLILGLAIGGILGYFIE
jgi:hypothetical protein